MLSKCPECKGKVSSYAEKCPHCGCPLVWIQQSQGVKESMAYRLGRSFGKDPSGCAIKIFLIFTFVCGTIAAICKASAQSNIDSFKRDYERGRYTPQWSPDGSSLKMIRNW